MLLNEPTATNRVARFFLVDSSGAGVAGVSRAAGAVVQLAKNGGSAVNTTNDLVAGAIVGSYTCQLTATEVNTAGPLFVNVQTGTFATPFKQFVADYNVDDAQLNSNTISEIQTGLALESDVLTIGGIVATIPTNPLLTTDSRLNHLDANVSAVAAAVWEALVASHRAAGSFGEIVQVIAGLMHLNVVIDGGAGEPDVILDGNKFMTAARVRAFASQTAQAAAVAGHADGADGEIFRFAIAATDVLGGFLGNYGLGRVA